MPKRWTNEEVELLKELFSVSSREVLTDTLQRTWPGIKGKARELGLKRGIDKHQGIELEDKFGRLTVTDPVYTKGLIKSWLCECECGTMRIVSGRSLKHGNTKSCGCLQKAMQSRRFTKMNLKHGLAHKVPEYSVWKEIKRRCNNPNRPGYQDYGGRGIKIHPLWEDDFAKFYKDMGPRPSKDHTIERTNNDLGYEPGNCKWATRKEQNRNTRRNRYITYNNETKTIAAWSEETGIKPGILWGRLNRNWSVKDTLTKPVRVVEPRAEPLFEYLGKSQTITQWALEYDLHRSTLANRIDRNGWSINKALETPVRKSNRRKKL